MKKDFQISGTSLILQHKSLINFKSNPEKPNPKVNVPPRTSTLFIRYRIENADDVLVIGVGFVLLKADILRLAD